MTDVFISYERGSEPAALRIAGLLRKAGFEVWLDADLPPSRAYADEIRDHLEAAKAVLVLWSAAAAQSEWVRAEADLARERRKLVQVSLDGALPPMPFNQIHCDALTGWRGNAPPAVWAKVLAAVEELVRGEITAPSSPAPPRRRASPRWVWLALALLVAVGAGAWLIRDHLGGRPATGPARLAIAPFRLESAAPTARFFADGLADQIQSALNDKQFLVVSRSHAQDLIGPGAEQAIRRLGVRLLFDGAVQQDGQALSVTVNLNDTLNHVSVWSSRVDVDAGKAEALRVQVAALIVTVLNCAGRALDPKDGLRDPQVLTQYLIACDRFARSGEDRPDTMEEMLSALRKVNSRAPNFPPAHSALAKYLAYYAAVLPPDRAAAARREAAVEAAQALRLDPGDADAYVALALNEPERNWARREDLLRKAVAANPDWPYANGFLGLLLQETGRVQEAAIYLDKAAAEDRPGQNEEGAAAIELVAVGKVAQADADYDEMLRYWPDSPGLWGERYLVRLEEGRWDDALAVLHEPVAARSMSPDKLAGARALVAAAKSRAPQQKEAARRWLVASAAQGGSLTNAIRGLAMLGYLDDAFRLADRFEPKQVLTGEGANLFFLPTTSAMRHDPRFMKLAERVGLAGFWRQTGRWPDFCREPDLPYRCH